MSIAGDALGTAMNTGQAAVRDTFVAAHPPGSKPPASEADYVALALAIDKARGNAVEVAIEAAVTGASPLAIVAAVNLSAGQPVYVDGTSGQLRLATAATFASATVSGLTQASTLATFAAPIATTMIALSDWTAVIGTPLLTKGARYFLGIAPGTLSLIAPSTPGQSVVSVGVALSTTQLEINPTVPILL